MATLAQLQARLKQLRTARKRKTLGMGALPQKRSDARLKATSWYDQRIAVVQRQISEMKKRKK